MDRSPYRSAQRGSGPDPSASYLPQLRPALVVLALGVGAYGATRTPPPTTWPTVVTCDDYAVSSPIIAFPPPPVRPRECTCRVPSSLEATGRPRPRIQQIRCDDAADAIVALGRTVPPGATPRVGIEGHGPSDVDGVALHARTCRTARCKLLATFFVDERTGGVGFARAAWLAVAFVLALLSIPTRIATIRVDRATGTVRAAERALLGKRRSTDVALADVVDVVDDDDGLALLLRDGRRLILTATDWRPTALRVRTLARARGVLAAARGEEIEVDPEG